uniref:Transmembrane protein n=1 Tax=Strongyloides papillosus TaxID=174720 RepID=A0A0N5BVY9_STREA
MASTSIEEDNRCVGEKKKDYLLRCSSLQIKIFIFLLFLISIFAMTVFLWMHHSKLSVSLYGTFLCFMFVLCCLFGNWLSQAENGINSVVEIRKNGIFLSTSLPIEEYSGLNSSLYEELCIPTHIHNNNDMTSDYNPILFESDNIDITTTPDSVCSLENYHVANYSLNELIRNNNSSIVLSTLYSDTSLNISFTPNSLPILTQQNSITLTQILVPEDVQPTTTNIANYNNNNNSIFYISTPQNHNICKEPPNDKRCQVTLSIENLPTYEEVTTTSSTFNVIQQQ